jgi:hypothetical protein
MNNKALVPLAAAAALLAGCAVFHWSGSPDPELSRNWVWSTGDLVISTEPARAAPAVVLPDKLPDTLYYADLGPDTIDVSSYTAQQQYNYGVFRQECARCHTLARAVNSPTESRLYWRFHLSRMSLHSRFNHMGRIPPAEMKALLDFLEYDAQIRKVQDRKRFDEQTEELKRRFEPILERVISQMRKAERPALNDQSW